MASTENFAQNGYAGEVLEDLLTYTAQGNDTYKEGLIHIKSGIQHKYTLPAIKLGDIIQDNVPTPTSTQGGSSDEFNKYTLTERYLEPADFMVYLEFNPRDYEKYWKFAQPEGNLVFRELDPKIQATMLRLLMDKKNGQRQCDQDKRKRRQCKCKSNRTFRMLQRSEMARKNTSMALSNALSTM